MSNDTGGPGSEIGSLAPDAVGGDHARDAGRSALPASASVASSSLTDLDLTRADFDTPDAAPTPCALCTRPLNESYFGLNGQAICRDCHDAVRQRLNLGTPMSRAIRATAAGAAAALTGTIIYFAVLALTGVEFGLLAIAVGYLIGKAVSWGSFGRGGWRYQALAMALTYLSIVSSYVPLVVRELGKNREQTAASTASTASTTTNRQARPASSGTVDARPVAPVNPPSPLPPVVGLFVGLLFLVVLACALPFLAGLQNVMGLIIIGIGVYEAWKFNKRPVVDLTGPHALAVPVTPAAAV